MPKSPSPSQQTSPIGNIVAHASCRVDLAGSTLDLWPLYLFHPGAVTVNFAVNILTRCQIIPGRDSSIHFKSIDTGREDHFRNFGEFCQAKKIQHHLAAHLIHFFMPAGPPGDRGFTIETNSESPAGAGISGSSALMAFIANPSQSLRRTSSRALCWCTPELHGSQESIIGKYSKRTSTETSASLATFSRSARSRARCMRLSNRATGPKWEGCWEKNGSFAAPMLLELPRR